MINKGQHRFQHKIREFNNVTKNTLLFEDLKGISENFTTIILKGLD